MEKLLTTGDVIDWLGGNAAVAEKMGVKPKTVWHWRDSGVFPSNTYVALTESLNSIGKTAPTSLWAMKSLSEESSA